MLVHHCTSCGGGREINNGAPAPAAPAADPVQQQREALSRAYKAPPAAAELLKPCPPEVERLSLAQWYSTGALALVTTRRGPQVAAQYRSKFGFSPPSKRDTRLYSHRELELLGLLVGEPRYL